MAGITKYGNDYLVNKLGNAQWLKQSKGHEKYLERVCKSVKAYMRTHEVELYAHGWGAGWCSSCDRMTDAGTVGEGRPCCDKCGDWLIFANKGSEEAK